MSRMSVVVSIALVFWSTSSCADWAVFGAGARCMTGKSFTILATVQVSPEDPQIGAVSLPDGFKELDRKNKFSCRVGKAVVDASTIAVGQQGQGMCMGQGYVGIRYLRIDGQPVFKHQVDFNWKCTNSARRLTKVKIFDDKGTPAVRVCSAKDWNYETGYSDVECNKVGGAVVESENKTHKY